MWDILSGYCVRTIANAHNDWIRKVNSSDDGAWYLSSGNDQVQSLDASELITRLPEYGMRKVKRQNPNTSYEVMNTLSNVLFLPLFQRTHISLIFLKRRSW